MQQRDNSAPVALLVDVETSGLYLEKVSMDDPSQPWCPQIAAGLITASGAFVNHFGHIVKADGRKIKENAQAVHGITDAAASRYGVPEPRVLGMLTDMLKTAPMTALRVVTYGDFDMKVIASLLARFAISLNKPSTAFDRLWLARPRTEFINLMTPFCQQICNLPPNFEGGDARWPTLDEAAATILGRAPRTGPHDGWDDLLIMRDLYVEIDRRGLLPSFAPAEA